MLRVQEIAQGCSAYAALRRGRRALRDRCRKYLARGGEGILRKFIADEILAKTTDPGEEIGKLESELTFLEAEADRLLDIATPACPGARA